MNDRRGDPPASSRVHRLADVLTVALATWAGRDDSKPQAEVRRAANTAMDAIDAMIAELHTMRRELTGEIRQADAAAADRVDAQLKKYRGGAS